MELLDRYLISVQQDLDHSLSHEKREDIIKEIRANILDELDAQTQQSGQKETDAQADALKDVLKQYGHPAATAQRYAPQAPLVKSEDMALYKKVLWHGAAVIFVFALLKTISSMLQSDSINPIRLLLQTGGHFLENIGLMLLIVTLCFYYLGKTQSLAAARYKNWTLEMDATVDERRHAAITGIFLRPRARTLALHTHCVIALILCICFVPIKPSYLAALEFATLRS